MGSGFITHPSVASQASMEPSAQPLARLRKARRVSSRRQSHQISQFRLVAVKLSRFHISAAYIWIQDVGVGSEGSTNCGSSGCFRPGASSITHPASLYGDYSCGSPYNLVVSAIESIRPLTGTSSNDSIGFSIFTGDLVVHMAQKQMSFDFQMYTESASYQMLNHFLSDSPVYAVIGNHDTGPESFDAPFPLPSTYGDLQKKNYAHLGAIWREFD